MKIIQILIKNADYALNNNLKSGHNGPYNDKETMVRIFSHWSIILLKVYQITGEKQYKKKAIEFLDYLFTKKARPYGFTFLNRSEKNKNQCNGLIGQAWCIEALMFGYEVLKKQKYLELAEHIFLMHPFSKGFGYWCKREVTGKKMFFDTTFNHQLWFAMAGSLIPNNIISNQIDIFMNRLKFNIGIYDNGLIKHLIFPSVTTPLYLLKNRVFNSEIDRKYLYEKENGYHAFNCYALSILRGKYPRHDFWKTSKFSKIMKYATSKEHFVISEENKYGFSYNPSGIEVAFFVHTFSDRIDNAEQIINERLRTQFHKNMDKETNLLTQNTSDPAILSARFYEIVRLADRYI